MIKPTLQSKTPNPPGAPIVILETSTSLPSANTPTPIRLGPPLAKAQTNLEIRSGPGSEYDLLGYLPEQAMAEIISRDETGQWWQIKTSLAAAGVGWIKSGSDFSEAAEAQNVPIALAPPTPTGTAPPVLSETPTSIATFTPAPPTSTSQPTATSVPSTPTPNTPKATATPTPAVSPTSEASFGPTAAPAPELPTGQFVLLKPTIDDTSTGSTEFDWRWDGPLAADQGFEVRVWREGEPPAGAHNAVEDNKNGYIVAIDNNTYRLTLNITDAAGVRGRGGEYLWTVVLVQISPDYKDLGIQAPPGRLRLGLGGGGGDGDGGEGGRDGPSF
ncbi:MAG: hypothetical protein HC875_14845 [Anaerolineales bacterium]|nr:hypothetical protein [Anaerolineales bacterium]